MSTTKKTNSGMNYNVVPMVGGVLLILDIICLLFTLWAGMWIFDYSLVPKSRAILSIHSFMQDISLVTIPALFVLYDKHFGAIVSRGNLWKLMRLHFIRFMVFAIFLLMLGFFIPVSDRLPEQVMLIWLAIGLTLTSCLRLLVAFTVRRYQRKGALTEVIAIVGAGPVTDRLVQALRHSHTDTVELLGVFDDKILDAPKSKIKAVGTIHDLLEVGKSRKIDWILLTLPSTAERRVQEITQRLKALSVPIGLCPQHVGLNIPYRIVEFVNDNVPVSLLTNHPKKRWDAVIKSADDVLPRWMVTLLILPFVVFGALLNRVVKYYVARLRKDVQSLRLLLANNDIKEFTGLAARYGIKRYGYVVTPNVDHIIRLHEEPTYRELYADADYTLLDSRFLSHLLRKTKKINLPVCTGSDLTENILSSVVRPDDLVVLIGGTEEQANRVRERYNLRQLHHFNPPMGFINDPAMVEACLQFIEIHSPFRYCFLAVGSPRQEILAQQLKSRGVARGLALCIGASINFLTGDELRAPEWMQQSGVEWVYRLFQAPKRMAKRYLLRGPRIFKLLFNTEFVLQEVSLPVENEVANDSAQNKAVHGSEPIYLQSAKTTGQTELSVSQ